MSVCADTGEQFRVQAVQDLLRHQAEEPAARLSQEPQNPQSILQRLQTEVMDLFQPIIFFILVRKKLKIQHSILLPFLPPPFPKKNTESFYP